MAYVIQATPACVLRALRSFKQSKSTVNSQQCNPQSDTRLTPSLDLEKRVVFGRIAARLVKMNSLLTHPDPHSQPVGYSFSEQSSGAKQHSFYP